MKPNKIGTWLPVFTGFYDNFYWEPDIENDAEYYKEQYGFTSRDLWEYLDYQAWYLHICKQFCSILEDKLKNFVKSIEFEELRSPREYNFTSDSINCLIIPKKREIKKYVYANREAFDKYLHEQYTSRDGFSSWYDNNFEDWETNTSKFTDLTHKHYLGAILNFICINEDIKESDVHEDMVDSSELLSSEFFKEELYQKFDDIEIKAQELYGKNERLSVLTEEFGKEFDVEQVIRKVDKEIEKQTLELKFKK